jgi:ADP-heptose:LPS heptosyltransferase
MTRVLVIRACAIGDLVLNIPALEALFRHQKDVQFTLVGYPATLELAREFLPDHSVEAIVSIETRPWSGLFQSVIPGLEFDSAIVWMKDPTVAQNLKGSGIQHVLRADPFPLTGHAAEHLLKTIGLPPPDLPDKWSTGATRVLLHPGSGSPRKCWPYFNVLADRITELATALSERMPATFLAGPNEEHFVTQHPKLEGLSLREVARELITCRAYVGNDSGITHLAAYLGVPTIALFGPTDPRIWGPLGKRVHTIHKPTLAEISVEDVLQYLA